MLHSSVSTKAGNTNARQVRNESASPGTSARMYRNRPVHSSAITLRGRLARETPRPPAAKCRSRAPQTVAPRRKRNPPAPKEGRQRRTGQHKRCHGQVLPECPGDVVGRKGGSFGHAIERELSSFIDQ